MDWLLTDSCAWNYRDCAVRVINGLWNGQLAVAFKTMNWHLRDLDSRTCDPCHCSAIHHILWLKQKQHAASVSCFPLGYFLPPWPNPCTNRGESDSEAVLRSRRHRISDSVHYHSAKGVHGVPCQQYQLRCCRGSPPLSPLCFVLL